MSIRRPRILALAGVPLLALAACGDLLTDDTPGPQRVLVQLNEAEFGRKLRAGYPVRLELFASDPGGLGVGGVEVRWTPGEGHGTVTPDRDRTNGNGFIEAIWTPGTAAGDQRVRVEADGIATADTLQMTILPDTVVGSVVLRAEADSLVEGESQSVALERVADRYGNPYDLAGGGDLAPPPVTFASLDPAVLEVAVDGTTARVTGLAPGTGRVVAASGGKADTVQVIVRKFVPPGSFRLVRAGSFYGCGATPTGGAYCWGENGLGQLGLGTSDSPVPAPAAVAALAGTDVTDFGVSELHTCAVASGALWCWGDNSAGQLGDGTFDPRLAPVRVDAPAGTVFQAVGAGLAHTCALAEDGAVWCWGDNSAGQLGTDAGPGDPSAVPVRVAAPAGVSFSALSVGGVHSCALTAAGAAWCWGDNSTGQLGNGTFDPATGVTEVQGAGFTQLGAGFLHSCAVAAAGQVLCWGDNSAGQLGNGGADPSPVPVPVSGTLAAAQVSAGSFHSCAVTADGRAFCWGANGSGQLGNGSDEAASAPVEVASGAIRFTAVDAGNEHSCALGTDLEAYCWGRNAAGELGTGTAGGPSLRPVRVASPAAPVTARASVTRPAGARARPPRVPAACADLPSRTRTKLRICR